MSDAPQTRTPADARRESADQFLGITVIVILALLTVFEFVVAIAVDDTIGLIAGLTPFALGKAGLIFWYFMHVYKLWRGEEDHG